MSEPQLLDSEDNEIDSFPTTDEDVLDGNTPDDDDPFWWVDDDDGVSDWWLTSATLPRPAAAPLRCPHPGCGGQLMACPDIPGVSDLICLLCRRTIGEALSSDLERWVGRDGMDRAARMAEAPLWIRDEASPS